MPVAPASLLLAAAMLVPSGAQLARTQIAVERQLEFHSSVLLNLHHVLYAAAVDRQGDERRIREGGLSASMTDEERQVWESAVDYYARELASRDLHTGEGMTAIKQALIRDDLTPLNSRHREALERALPIYRWYFWPSHDRENRAWTADTLTRFREVAPAVVPRLERLLGMPWPASRTRVDVVWVAKPAPYTTLDPLHIVMGSTDPHAQQWHGVELLLHEIAHGAAGTLQREFATAFGQRGAPPTDMWHAALFYVTGETLRQALDLRRIAYQPYLYSTGLFNRAWGAARPAIEANLRGLVEGRIALPEAASRLATAIQAAPESTDPPAAEFSGLRFHSSFWLNLHHTLYAAAWARRPDAGLLSAFAARLPLPLDAPLTDPERAAWNGAVEYYDRQIAPKDLLFGRGMEALKMALVTGDLESAAVDPPLGDALRAAAPVYQKHYWPAQDGANRAWIGTTVERLKTIAVDVIPRLEKAYGSKWFVFPVRVDIVWVGSRQGAYTTLGPPPHVVISSGEAESSAWTAPEMVFHETSHLLVDPLRDALARALGPRLREHAQLWHVIQFYVTGAIVQQVLRARGIEYDPYVYATGLFDRAWGRYRKAVEENWQPYLEGKATMEDAIARTVQAVAR